MKKYLLSSVAALGLVAAGAASAADLPSRKGPVAAPIYVAPAFTWTGFYVGLNAGYGFGHGNNNAGNLIRSQDGFVGGGQIGYNYQMGQFVLGLETDLQYSDMKAGPSVAGLGVVRKYETEYFGTVRARAGFAFDRFLPYVTAGLAYGNTKVTLAPGVLAGGLNSDNKTQVGYSVGAGVEYAFTNNLTAKLEYLYNDLGSDRFFNGTLRSSNRFSVVRAGVNYKF